MSLTSASHALKPLAYSWAFLCIFCCQGNPVSEADVQKEKEALSRRIASAKAHAVQSLRGANPFVFNLATQGTSLIENKLQAVNTQTEQARTDIPALVLGSKVIRKSLKVEKAQSIVYRPPGTFPVFLDAQGRDNPENYLSTEELATGAHILTPLKTIPVPNCLTEQEVNEYVTIRLERGWQLGDYWRLLFSGTASFPELAQLRYYDYIETHATSRPVLVFRCTTVRGRAG